MRSRIPGLQPTPAAAGNVRQIRVAEYLGNQLQSNSGAYVDIWGTNASPILSVDILPGSALLVDCLIPRRMDSATTWNLSFVRIVETTTGKISPAPLYNGAHCTGVIFPVHVRWYWTSPPAGVLKFKVQASCYNAETTYFHYNNNDPVTHMSSTLTVTELLR